MENDKRDVLWNLAAQLHEAVSEQIAFAFRGTCAPVILRAARRLVNRCVCSGQTRLSSQSTREGSAGSSGLSSRPARQTICGIALGSGVALFTEQSTPSTCLA
jgi:hypothetical protein